jgi:hypothetical protein
MKYGKVNTKGLKELQKSLKHLEEPSQFAEACARELAARLLAKVTKRTPVGQYPKGSGMMGGTLRRGWTGSKRSSTSSYVDALPITYTDGKYVIEIINPTEYASYVEFGHRTVNHEGWVRGQFMMTISEKELQEIAPELLEKRIREYLRRCFP